jgi:hypothetical protein
MEVLPGEDGGTVLLDIWGLQRPMAAVEASAPKRTAPRRAPATSLNNISLSLEALEPE